MSFRSIIWRVSCTYVLSNLLEVDYYRSHVPVPAVQKFGLGVAEYNSYHH